MAVQCENNRKHKATGVYKTTEGSYYYLCEACAEKDFPTAHVVELVSG